MEIDPLMVLVVLQEPSRGFQTCRSYVQGWGSDGGMPCVAAGAGWHLAWGGPGPCRVEG